VTSGKFGSVTVWMLRIQAVAIRHAADARLGLRRFRSAPARMAGDADNRHVSGFHHHPLVSVWNLQADGCGATSHLRES